MGTQKQALIILSFCLIAACGKIVAANEQLSIKEAQDFRQYAAAICLGASFPEESVKADANRSANVYLGNVDLGAYEAVRIQLRTWNPDGFSTKNGGQAVIARCLEFSESNVVSGIFRQFNPCRNKDAWLDQQAFKAQCK